jgi:alkylhydroperoxidase family enzyme
VAHIEITRPGEAVGSLKDLYDQAMGRAGKVYQIVQLMSPNPDTMRASIGLYMASMHGATMHGRSGVSRSRREMLATVVSRINGCRY